METHSAKNFERGSSGGGSRDNELARVLDAKIIDSRNIFGSREHMKRFRT